MDPLALQVLEDKTVTDDEGKQHPLHSQTELPQCEFIHQLVLDLRPQVSVEVGLAYGISALTICHALRMVGAKKHYVMDPFQAKHYQNVGLRHLKLAGYADLVDFRQKFAHERLPQLLEDGVKVDFAYLDGSKVFDVVMVNIYYLTLMMNVGGLIVLDDCDFPGIRKLCSFLAVHPSYEVIASRGGGKLKRPPMMARAVTRLVPDRLGVLGPQNLLRHPLLSSTPHCVVIKKVKDDDRRWDWHADF